jgi:hypothetical protein
MKSAALLILVCAAAAIAADTTTRPDISIQDQPTTRRSSFSFDGGFRNRRERRYEQQQNPPIIANLPAITEEVGARNIFVKGNQRSLPPQPLPPPGPLPPSGPTAIQLVLTGVSLSDYGKLAFLEDQSTYTVTRVQVGDTIAMGKILSITLNSLDYRDASGRIIRVEVGYNLAGGDVWGVSASTSSPGASTQPSRSGPRQPGESMEDYLKRRRQEEMGH